MSAWAPGAWAPGAWAGTVWAEDAATETVVTSLGAALQLARSASASISAPVQEGRSSSANLSAMIQAGLTAAADLSASVQEAHTAASSLQTAVLATTSSSIAMSVQVQGDGQINTQIGLALQAAYTAAADLQTAVQEARTAFVGIAAQVQAPAEINTQLSAMIQNAIGAFSDLSVAIMDARSTDPVAISAYVATAGITSALLDSAIQIAYERSVGMSVMVDASNWDFTGERYVVIPADTPYVGLDLPWMLPRFYMRAGSTLDFTFKWAKWLSALEDFIESFEIDPGDYLTVAGSTHNVADIRTYVTAADDLPRRRVRTTLTCKITTVGEGGFRRVESRDILLIITRP